LWPPSWAYLALPGVALAIGLVWAAPRGAHAAGSAGTAHGAPAASAAPSTGRILRDRLGPIAVIMAIAITRGTVTTAISTFWPLLHQHTVAGLFGSSTVIAVMLTAGGIGNVWGGRLSDRLPHHRLLALTCVGAALSLAVFALVHGPWTYVFAALSGLFGMSGFAVTTVMGQNLIPERVAMASGLFFGLANAITSATVALLALAAAAWGGSVALLLTAAVCLSGLAATLAYPSVCGGRMGRVGTPEVSAATT
jgi:MFS family permease